MSNLRQWPDHEELMGLVEKYGDAMMDAITAANKELGRDLIDARAVAVAAARVGGCFVSGIAAPELKREIVRHWLEQFALASDEPFEIVNRQ